MNKHNLFLISAATAMITILILSIAVPVEQISTQSELSGMRVWLFTIIVDVDETLVYGNTDLANRTITVSRSADFGTWIGYTFTDDDLVIDKYYDKDNRLVITGYFVMP